jgi:hypothetical protein
MAAPSTGPDTGPDAAVERVIAPSRRPDGSLRKEIRIRAGYTPQDEVAIYQPKGAQVRLFLPLFPSFPSPFVFSHSP